MRPAMQSLNHGIEAFDEPPRSAEKAQVFTWLMTIQIAQFRDLRRQNKLAMPAISRAIHPSIFAGPKIHFDLVRTVRGRSMKINPTPGKPMIAVLPVMELRARIVQVRDLAGAKPLPTIPAGPRSSARGSFWSRSGYGVGYPHASRGRQQAASHRCRPPLSCHRTSIDGVLPIDVTDLLGSGGRALLARWRR